MREDSIAVGETLPLSDADFAFISDYLYRRAGIRMGEHKRALISGRLSKRALSLGYSSFSEYFREIRAEAGEREYEVLLNLLTTNHSFFYREREHFDFLSSVVLPRLLRNPRSPGAPELRIWSAGCAGGEEAYSIAMTVLREAGPGSERADFGILATDISSTALQEGVAGVYPAARLKELPRPLLEKYMVRRDEGAWEVGPEARSLVLFKRLNLMQGDFPFKGLFDVVFCRNVMIYFDADSRRRLVESLHKVVKPGGFLFIGHSESIQRGDCPFDYVKPAIYRKAG